MNIQAMMKQAQKLQKEMMETKKIIDETVFTGESSFVKVSVYGNKKIKEIFFSQKTDTDTAKGKATATETGTVKEKAASGGKPCFL